MPEPIPTVIVRCCREWEVAFGYQLGECGICGSRRFEFVRMVDEKDWPQPKSEETSDV